MSALLQKRRSLHESCQTKQAVGALRGSG